MTGRSSCVFAGKVVHKRLVPREHGFAYSVFALCLDLDEIDALDDQLHLFSRNRRNVLSFWDGDLGRPGSESVAAKARALLAEAGLEHHGARISLLCYPRLFGYVFNPLSVYFCHDAAGRLGTIVYEVTNTFRERKSYVIPTQCGAATIAQTCTKELYVSPFTEATGSYGFHAIPPGERVVVGVNFREEGRPVLRTHFSGMRRELTDRAIRGLVLGFPLMTLKVIAGIHLQALRLWLKGVPVVTRHVSPSYSYTLVKTGMGGAQHA
jgi:hypothetical protein